MSIIETEVRLIADLNCEINRAIILNCNHVLGWSVETDTCFIKCRKSPASKVVFGEVLITKYCHLP